MTAKQSLHFRRELQHIRHMVLTEKGQLKLGECDCARKVVAFCSLRKATVAEIATHLTFSRNLIRQIVAPLIDSGRLRHAGTRLVSCGSQLPGGTGNGVRTTDRPRRRANRRPRMRRLHSTAL
jgi:hypothetical protein